MSHSCRSSLSDHLTRTVIVTFGFVLFLAANSIAAGPSVGSVFSQDGWHDTDRSKCNKSDWTANDDNKRCQPSCDACSPGDGKWCASRRHIQLKITNDDDPQQLTRFKPLGPGVCPNVWVEDGPTEGWMAVEGCEFSAAQRSFDVSVIGWTKPQRFKTCLMLQERDTTTQ